MVELRMDARIRGRLDASDVLQESYLDVAHDIEAYLKDPKLRLMLWLRLHVGRRLTTVHRQHLGTRMRDAGMDDRQLRCRDDRSRTNRLVRRRAGDRGS